MEKKQIIIATVFTISILGWTVNSFLHMNREVKYESLYNPQCIFDESKKTLYFSFVFVDSFLTITSYKLTQKHEGDRVLFFITLAGKNASKPEDVIVNKNIRKKDGRIEVIIPGVSYNPTKDEFAYKVGPKIYRIQITTKLG